MSNNINSNSLIIPVYINEKIVLDMLAIMEDGFSMVSQINYTEHAESNSMQRGDVGLSTSATILSKLLKIDVSGKLGTEGNRGENENVIKEKKIPVVFLTAKDDENDIVKGLNLGAEDYMTKPFSTKELLARVDKIILRKKLTKSIKVKNITFDFDKMICFRDNEVIELSSLELKIIHLLFNHVGKVVKRATILDRIWDWTGNDVDDHTVTVYLKRIREKLGTDIITTVKGIGYRIDE